MYKSKLILLLKTLNKKEIKKLGEFVNSPFYNKNKNIKALFAVLINFHPDYESKNIEIENIYKELFPGKEFNYYRISNVISDLLQLAKMYLTVQAAESDSIKSKILLLEEFNKRNLEVFSTQTDNEIKKDLESLAIKDENFYLDNYLLNRSKSIYYKISGSNLEFNMLQAEYDSFYEYTLVTILKLFTKMLYNKNHGKIEFNIKMFEEIWGYVKKTDLEGNTLYSIYKTIISLELEKDEKEYRKLLKLKDVYLSHLSDEDLYNIYIFMNSFISYRLNKFGDEKYYNDRFMVLKETIDHGFISPEFISFSDYTYFYIAACTVGEFEWAENFKDKFKTGIRPAEETDNSVNFCNAFINYRKKNFEKALDFFSKTNFKLYFLKVTVKSFTVRILYEMNLEEQALTALDAFRHYLKNEKLILEDQKRAHYDFLKYTAELFKIRNDHSGRDALDELNEKILSMDNSAYGVKNWLLKKAEELVKS